MPEVEIKIGGRSFEVSCQEGEESFLKAAAAALDHEAQKLADQLGRISETRVLLMAGLMLADKMASQKDKMEKLDEDLSAAMTEITRLKTLQNNSHLNETPQEFTKNLNEIALKAEAIANRING